MTPRHCLLDRTAVIAVRGVDAQSFLHAQLSFDIATLAPGHAPLAGWHDPKGRVRALFRVLRQDDRWLLLTPHDTVQSLVPRLKMYVLRAAVDIAPEPGLQAAAVLDADEWAAARGIGAAPADAVSTNDTLHWIRVGAGLVHVVGPASAIAAAVRGLDAAPSEHADLAEIRLGLPAVTHAVAERFVAQMLNLDRIGAISFAKGCYPGQEIVARVHNLGSVKRRMRRYSASGSDVPAAGSEVLGGDGTAVGEVVRAARAADRIELLAVVEHESASSMLTVAPGLTLTPETLPYDVPAR